MSIEVRTQNTISLTSVKAIKEAADAAETLAGQAAVSASNAEASAATAAQAATNAQASATAAQASAGEAATAAGNAGRSASSAQAASEAAQAAALATITTDTLHYLATSQSSGVTTSTTGWTTTPQAMDSTNRYLWTYHTYTTANGTTTDTTPVITGVYGQQGQQGVQGVSVTSVQPQYYLSTSSSTTAGGSWSNSLTYVAGKYIWTRDMVAYSNGTSAPSTEIYNEALTDACKDAAQALGLIQDQQEWFWHDSLGAHVLGETSGYRNDITSSGMAIVDTNTNTTVATFGTETVIRTSSGTELAHFGYGSTAGGTGASATAPFYYFGKTAPPATPFPTWTSGSDYKRGDIVTYSQLAYIATTIKSNDTTAPPNSNTWVRIIIPTSVSKGAYSFATGDGVRALGYASHAEGGNSQSSQSGYNTYTTAAGSRSHAEGEDVIAIGSRSHAEGYGTTTEGGYSHAEGYGCYAGGDASHAEGYQTEAYGDYSHAQNYLTIAGYDYQTVAGKWNSNQSDTAFEIGNGTGVAARSNAFTVDWSGRIKCGNYAGTLTSIFDLFYPVGSYYETSDTTFNPNTVWGGTWSLETEGLVHIGAGTNYTVGATGGEASHTLTVNEMPSHTHNDGTSASVAYGGTSGNSTAQVSFDASAGRATTSAGGGQAHNNMQPYVVVNRWHRTA